MKKIIKYEEDKTGVSPDNFIKDEVHNKLTGRRLKICVPYAGSFYTESMVITDLSTSLPLDKSRYSFDQFETQLMLETAKEIATAIIIDAPDVKDISLTYQCFGGRGQINTNAIFEQFQNLELDDRSVFWDFIKGKPTQFPPTEHLHNIGDVFGFEYVAYGLDRICSAILRGDEISHSNILEYIDSKDNDIYDLLKKLKEALRLHEEDTNNPHKVTAEQVGAYTKEEVSGFLDKLTDIINRHINDTNNPHKVTAAQLSVYLKSEVDKLLEFLENKLNTKIDNHVNDTNNPHKVTAEQVGTWNSEEIKNGFNTVNDSLAKHVNNVDNPHKVTAEQVGAYTKQGTDDKINSIIDSRVLDPKNNFKVREKAFPISSEKGNLISWRNDGSSVTLNDIPEAGDNQKGVVKLTDSLNSTEPNTALSATGGKKLNDNKVEKSTRIIVDKGLVGGGQLSNDVYISMGVPESLTEYTVNKVDGGTHSHYVSRASVNGKGIVQLIDSSKSNSTDMAPTAKALNDLRNELLNEINKNRDYAIRQFNNLANFSFNGSGYGGGSILVNVIPNRTLQITLFGYLRQAEAQYTKPETNYGLSVCKSTESLSVSPGGGFVPSTYIPSLPGDVLIFEQVGRNFSGWINRTVYYNLPYPGHPLFSVDSWIRINFLATQRASSNGNVHPFLSGSNLAIDARLV